MSTARKLMHNKNNDNWDTLPVKTKELIKNLIIQAAQDRAGPEGWKSDDDAIEEIEYQSRDGFIADSSNHGGLTYRNFTDLMGYFGGGYTVAHEGAAKEIERQIEYSMECAREGFCDKYAKLLEVKNIDPKTVNYHMLSDSKDPELRELTEEFGNYEYENLGDSKSSIMHEIRFLYHGKDETGLYTASVSAAVNTEGPYHRSSISWAPGVFCEGAKEVEITWKNQAELKRKLTKALKEVSEAIF